MPIGSILGKAIKNLPKTVKAESLPNILKKAGVKQEELDYAKLDLPKTGKVSKEDLVKAEAGRKDFFSTESGGDAYSGYSLPKGKNNPTYREKVTTFKEKGVTSSSLDNPQSRKALTEAKELLGDLEEIDAIELVKANFSDSEGIMGLLKDGHTVDEIFQIAGGSGKNEPSRYTTGHFPDIPDYLMHTRVYDDSFDGVPTRVVQEIQSDLHQAGRQQGYNRGPEADVVLRDMEDLRADTQDEAIPLADLLRRAEEAGFQPNGLTEETGIFEAIEDFATTRIFDIGGGPGVDTLSIPKSPFEKTWLRKGMEREINDALEEGMGQIAIPISGNVGSLSRGEGVQKWYENVVAKTAEKLAKSKGMDFEMKTVYEGAQDSVDYALSAMRRLEEAVKNDLPNREIDELSDEASEAIRAAGWRHDADAVWENPRLLEKLRDQEGAVTYAVIKPKAGAAKPDFALYSTPAAAIGAAAIMIKEGHSQADIEALLTEEGFEADEIQDIFGQANAAATMKAEGYTDEEIQPLLSSQEVEATGSTSKASSAMQDPTPGRMSDAYVTLTSSEELTIKELVAKMEIVYPDMSSVTTNIAGFLGDQEAHRQSEAAALASRSRIVDEAAKRGMQLRWDEKQQDWIATTEDGEFIVTPEWYRSFWEAKGELLGAVGGALAGGARAANLASKAPIPHPLVKAALVAGSTLIGGAIGAFGGTELDYMHDAMILQQDFEGEVMARKAMTAVELSIIGDTVGAGVFKIGGAAWSGLKNVRDLVSRGLFDKAHTALKETMFVTDDEAADLINKLSRVATIPGKPGTDQAVAAVALTKPGAEDLVKAAVATDSTAGQAVAKGIADRAKDLLTSTKELSGDDIGRWIREDLEGYKTLVKDDFTRVKNAAASAPGTNRFTFDYDKLAIDPVLKRLQGNIENKDLAYKFARQSTKIRNMSKSRRLPDLIELRKLVNEFRFNSRISNVKDYEMLDELKAGIDHAIESGAFATMDNPKAWLSSWKASNKAYSEMKVLEKNTLMKILIRPGVSEKAIGQALTKYSGALDSTFVDILAKLPKKSRMRVEGAVINNLTEKFTAGLEGGQRAVNFPMLQKELDGVTFTSPEARSMKRAINELAEVFRNDVPLSQAAGGIQIQKFQSFLTADPVIRAKFEIASGVFNYVSSLKPTQAARSLSLVRKTAKVLENPMNSKSIRELREELDGEVNIDEVLSDLVKGSVQRLSTDGGMPRVKLYGDGKVLAGKGGGKEHSIPMHRIADTDAIKQIAEASGINLADKKALDLALKEHGYMAAQLGADKVRLLEK